MGQNNSEWGCPGLLGLYPCTWKPSHPTFEGTRMGTPPMKAHVGAEPKVLNNTAAKSLQSCPTLCDPIDSSPPGSPVPGILQARTLEWVAISFTGSTRQNKLFLLFSPDKCPFLFSLARLYFQYPDNSYYYTILCYTTTISCAQSVVGGYNSENSINTFSEWRDCFLWSSIAHPWSGTFWGSHCGSFGQLQWRNMGCSRMCTHRQTFHICWERKDWKLFSIIWQFSNNLFI